MYKLFFDESGAKGYSDNREKHPGQIGVMAGFILPSHMVSIVQLDLNSIAENYFSEGKLHITDLDPDQQQSLREEVFSYFIRQGVGWVYEAIYVDGFYKNAYKLKELEESVKASNKSSIKISSNEKKDLLHAELFLGVFAKAITITEQHVGNKFHMDFISDTLDKSIIKKFEAKAEEYLNIGNMRSDVVTGYDPNKKEKVSGVITMEVTAGKHLLGDYSNVTYSVGCEDTSLTLAADILANSTNYFLGDKQRTSLGISLNTNDAISCHPLRLTVQGVSSPNDGLYFPDAIYRRD